MSQASVISDHTRLGARAAPPPPAHWHGPAAESRAGGLRVAWHDVAPVAGGFFARLAAHLIDHVVVGVPIAVLVAIAIVTDLRDLELAHLAPADLVATFGPMALLYGGASTLAWGIYEIGTTSSAWGATIGKRALTLRIVRYDGRPLGFGRATGRFLAKTLVSPLLPFGAGYLMALAGSRKRALHDVIAGTVVVRADRPLRALPLAGPANDERSTVSRSVVLAAMGRQVAD